MKQESLLKGNAFFEKYIRKHWLKYAIVLILYGIGFVVGIGFFNHTISADGESETVVQTITQSMEWFEEGTTDMLGNYVKEDFMEWFVLVLFSCSFLGIPLMLIFLFVKAVSLGVTVSALIYSGGVGYGMSFSILVFMVPTLLKIVTLLMLLCSSLKFFENIFKYQKEMKYEFVRHAFTVFLTCFIMGGLVLYRAFSLNLVNHILF